MQTIFKSSNDSEAFEFFNNLSQKPLTVRVFA
jgi:hypothetical protein